MEYKEILLRLAPCGLDCSRCFRFHDSEIKQLSKKLTELLYGFEDVAEKISTWLPQLRKYPEFKEVLDLLQHGECRGCRYDKCIFPCGTQDCFREKGIDFCFQCDEYPCTHPPLTKKWRKINDMMSQLGIEKYYEEQLHIPRYSPHWSQ